MLCIYDEIITSDFEFGNPTSKKKKEFDIDLIYLIYVLDFHRSKFDW